MNTETQIITPEEMRIAIALHCGFKWTVLNYGTYNQRVLEMGDNDGPADGTEHLHWSALKTVPDYLNDLNAMHEAEATIRGDARWQTYKKELRDICDSAYPCEDPYHAPAKLRAEAFLMTIQAPKL